MTDQVDMLSTYIMTDQLYLLCLLYYDRPARSSVYYIMTDQLDLLSLLYYDRPARSTVSIVL